MYVEAFGVRLWSACPTYEFIITRMTISQNGFRQQWKESTRITYYTNYQQRLFKFHIQHNQKGNDKIYITKNLQHKFI
jgi:hypothetical protein